MSLSLGRALLLGALVVFVGCVRAVSPPTFSKADGGLDTVGVDTVGVDTVGVDTVGADTFGQDTRAVDTQPACVDPCDDGDPCTKNDICAGGLCRGVAYTCTDGDQCTTDHCQGDGTCIFAAIDPCDAGYALGFSQPSGSITSTSNRVLLYKLTKTVKTWKMTTLADMGSFKSAPTWWDFWYDSTNPPENCHDRHALHAGTPYEGLDERNFVGASKADFIARLKARLTEKYTLRAGSNFSGGDLCKSGNFWTTMKVTVAGITHIQTELAKF